MADSIEFLVNGNRLTLSRTQVERAMVNVRPEPIQRHSVEVSGVRFPVKQVFSEATGLDRLDFTSSIARRNLGKLGFVLSRASD